MLKSVFLPPTQPKQRLQPGADWPTDGTRRHDSRDAPHLVRLAEQLQKFPASNPERILQATLLECEKSPASGK